jgi:hypothetical protein
VPRTDREELHTVVQDGPDGIVLALHGFLSRLNAPGVDSLLACLDECERRRATVDLRNAELEPGVVELVTRRWRIVA